MDNCVFVFTSHTHSGFATGFYAKTVRVSASQTHAFTYHFVFMYFRPFSMLLRLHKFLESYTNKIFLMCFRYEMSNCLFEASYEEVLLKCNCTPSFHQTGISEYPMICTGTKLKCMTEILHRIGKYNMVSLSTALLL